MLFQVSKNTWQAYDWTADRQGLIKEDLSRGTDTAANIASS